jgi:hypothetical protein
MSKERDRRNLRMGLFLGAIALASLLGFIYKVWRLG